MRCLAFAETLAWAGWSATIITRRESVTTAPMLSASGHTVRLVDESDDGTMADGTGLVVVDNYQLDASYERTVTAPGRTVVAFDDLADRSHACDILVDPTPGRSPADYAKWVPQSARLLLGPRHALVRRIWLAQRVKARARLAAKRAVKRIIVAMGATDPSDTTSRVLDGIRASHLDVAVDVVLGPGAPHRANVAATIGPGMMLHVDPQNLPELAAQADLAIGAPGSSSFERALIGLPAILIPNADNQRYVAAAFSAGGAAEVLPAAILADPVALGARIAALARDDTRCAAMARAAFDLTDGRGALRLLAAVAGDAALQRGGSIFLRLAEENDSEWLFDLQSKPETRRFALNPVSPTADEHSRWFAATMDDPDRLLAIVVSAGRPVGMVRLDRTASVEATFQVSIAVDPARFGEGIGAATLALIRTMAPGADFVATVLADNIASLALFAAAGYRPDGQDRFRSCAA